MSEDINIDFKIENEESVESVFNVENDDDMSFSAEMGGGVSEHDKLKNRDLPNQHPISAITGLETELAEKQPVIPDLEEIRQGAEKGKNALPSTTKYANDLSLTIDGQTYILTAQLKDQEGSPIGTPQTIDLPLETMIVGGSYDEDAKEVVLTLKNGETLRFSISDLISGLLTTDTEQTITGEKTFTQPMKIQNGQGTGSLWIGGNVNSGSLTNRQRHLARIVVPSFHDVTVGATLLGFDTSGDSSANVANKGYDSVVFGGSKKITNATSPMNIIFCVTKERGSTSASNKVYPLEMDGSEARFNVQPNYNGKDLATQDYVDGLVGDIETTLNGKQDVISDLSAIRTGAEKGNTAVQPDQLSTVATSGSYNDLTNKPTIPTKTSQLTNDSGFVYQDISVNTINTQYTTSKSDIQVSTVFNFEKQSTPINTRQRSVCYGNGYWVSCGLSGSLIYSTDGINWEAITPFCNGTLTGITYGNGYFVCVEYETGNVWKANEPNGDWEVIYTENSKIESVQYINNIFLITGENGMISLSEKGYIWNKKETGVTNNIIKATYGDGIYVAVGSGGLILTSINGNDWSIQESGITTDIRTVTYGNGRFICGGKSLLYSLNGISWQEATTPEAITGWIREFTYGEKRYYCSIYTSGGLGQIWYSNDAITWTKALNITTSNSRLWCITYGGGLFLSSGDNGVVYTLNLGNTWTYNIPNLSSNDHLWYRIGIIQNNGSKIYSDAYYIKIPNTSDFATKEELNDKQDKLTAGAGVDITDGTIKNTGLISATYDADNENLVLVGG